MIKLRDFWSMGKTEEMFECDFYSPFVGSAYSVKSISSELMPGYFSFWKTLVRRSFACVRMRQQDKNPVVMDVECVGVPRENATRVEGTYQGYIQKMSLREHYGDTLARVVEYKASQKKIERNLEETCRIAIRRFCS